MEGFTCPHLKAEIQGLIRKVQQKEEAIAILETTKSNLEGIVSSLKEQHREYINSLETESRRSLEYQKESLEERYHAELKEGRGCKCVVCYTQNNNKIT